MSIVWYFVALVVLIALSAFFSASEMSYSSANRLRLENAAEDGSRRAKTAVGILDHFARQQEQDEQDFLHFFACDYRTANL